MPSILQCVRQALAVSAIQKDHGVHYYVYYNYNVLIFSLRLLLTPPSRMIVSFLSGQVCFWNMPENSRRSQRTCLISLWLSKSTQLTPFATTIWLELMLLGVSVWVFFDLHWLGRWVAYPHKQHLYTTDLHYSQDAKNVKGSGRWKCWTPAAMLRISLLRLISVSLQLIPPVFSEPWPPIVSSAIANMFFHRAS